MARKVANGMNKRQAKRKDYEFDADPKFEERGSNFSIGESSGRLSADRIREFMDHPTVRYVAAGLATAVLQRLATNLSEKYPELSRFLKENIDGFEGKISQYRSGMGGGEERSSRV